MIPIALTIAGSDPSGGAGIQADLKTFHQLKVYGASAITLITVQNTTRVSRVELLDPSLVSEQIDSVLEDLPPQAAKTGALGTTAIIEAVARCARSVSAGGRSRHDQQAWSSADGFGGPRSTCGDCCCRRPRSSRRTSRKRRNWPDMTVDDLDQMREAAIRIERQDARC